MLPLFITKYLIAATIITILSIAETNAQLLNLNVLSFNNNRAGDNSLNRNGNAAVGPGFGGLAPGGNQAQQNSSNSLPSAIGAGLGFLAGTVLGRGFSYPNSYGFPYYGGYRPYYYYHPYPYYYYYRG